MVKWRFNTICIFTAWDAVWWWHSVPAETLSHSSASCMLCMRHGISWWYGTGAEMFVFSSLFICKYTAFFIDAARSCSPWANRLFLLSPSRHTSASPCSLLWLCSTFSYGSCRPYLPCCVLDTWQLWFNFPRWSRISQLRFRIYCSQRQNLKD